MARSSASLELAVDSLRKWLRANRSRSLEELQPYSRTVWLMWSLLSSPPQLMDRSSSLQLATPRYRQPKLSLHLLSLVPLPFVPRGISSIKRKLFS